MRFSPTAHWWQYPLARPSFRFQSTNKLALDLDAAFEALPPEIQRAWEYLRDVWSWSAECFEAVFGINPLEFVQATPKEVYTAVNMNRWQQGLRPIDAPPTVFTVPDGDSILLGLPSDFICTWSGRPSSPPGLFYATVSVKGLNHEPASGPALSRYSFAFGEPILYGVPFSLDPLRDLCPGLWGLPYTSLAVRIMDQGSAPFFGARVGFSQPV